MARGGINKRDLAKFHKKVQREVDRQGPIRIPVEAEPPELPHLAGGATVNYGPVFNGDMTGAQIAWDNATVTQNQQNATSAVAPGHEQLAKLVTDLLNDLPNVGLSDQDLQDAEEAANEVLAEITDSAPEPSKLRRSLIALRGVLAPVAGGLVTGVAGGAQEWAQEAIRGLTGIS